MTKDQITKKPEKMGRNRYNLPFQREQHRASLTSLDKDFFENVPQQDKGNGNQTGLPQQKNRQCFFINSQAEVRAQSHRKPLL